MKIVLNSYQYDVRLTGTDRMACNFINGLQKIDTENMYYVICSDETYIPSSISSTNFFVLKPNISLGNSFIESLYKKIWIRYIHLKVGLMRPDVYISFHNMRLPLLRVAKLRIASNLDLIPIVLNEYSKLSNKLNGQIKKTAKTADKFLSISNFSKEELIRVLGVKPHKINVIQLAADDTFSKHQRISFDVPKNYILTIGGSEPRKRVKDVVSAFNKLPLYFQKQYPLLVVGGDWHGKKLDNIDNPNIHMLGYVDDNDLPGLYQNASVFVFASEYEGFGFAILEAMTAKTPVITSDATSLNEVAGSAALKFKPGDIDQLATHIEKVLKNDDLAKDLIAKGTRQAKKFSWHKSATELHKLLTGVED